MAKRLETLWWTNHALPSWEETFLRNNGRWQIRESKKEPRFHMGVQKHYVLLRKVQTADNTILKKVSDSQTLRPHWRKCSKLLAAKQTYRDRHSLWGREQGVIFSWREAGSTRKKVQRLNLILLSYRTTHMPTLKQQWEFAWEPSRHTEKRANDLSLDFRFVIVKRKIQDTVETVKWQPIFQYSF